MPGPTTAVTIANGSLRRTAGAMVGLGHGVVEMPIMLLMFFGLATWLEMEEVRIGVGLGGGVVLWWMAWQAFKTKFQATDGAVPEVGQGAFTGGLVTTALNPYFYLWWATVGAALLTKARVFGNAGFAGLAITHVLCDIAWLLLISMIVFKTRRFWTPAIHRAIFFICGLVLAGFGVYFVVDSAKLLLQA